MKEEKNIQIKIALLDQENKPFMGIGIVWLMRAVQQHKSLKKAAESMHLSYSKANKMVRRVESVTGQPFLQSHKGGIERGGSVLTPFAKRYITAYEKMSQDLKENSQKFFYWFKNEIENFEKMEKL